MTLYPHFPHSPHRNAVFQNTSWPKPPSNAVWHGVAGEIVKRIEPHTEADPIALLLDLVTCYGNAIGRNRFFRADGAKHYQNLFVVLVGQTSKARKGTARARISEVMTSAATEWVTNCIQGGLSSGEGLIWAVRDPFGEGDPGVSDKRLLVHESEFASTLKVATRDTNILSAVLRQAWETGGLKTLSKNRPAAATDAHISLLGHVTEEELTRYLNSTEAGNGFGNRILWGSVKRSKMLPTGGNLSGLDFTALISQLGSAIRFGSEPGEITFSAAGEELWCSEYERLSTGSPGLYGSLTSRAEAQTLRLASIYALLEKASEIRTEHLRAALELWDYCARSVAHIFGTATGDPLADKILQTLEARQPEGVSRTQLNKMFSGHQFSSRLSTTLDLLRESKLAHSQSQETGGRPSEWWFWGPPDSPEQEPSPK